MTFADLARALGRGEDSHAVNRQRKKLKAGVKNVTRVYSKREFEEMADLSMSVSEAALKLGTSEARVRTQRERARKEKGKND